MQLDLHTVGTWSAVLVLPAILIASPAPQSTNAASAGTQSAIGPLACADSLNDQAGPGCLQASSTATSGLLFPYPGNNNAFAAPSVVAGGGNNSASGSYATVGGGYGNASLGSRATVGGGQENSAPGDFATVSGGRYNSASGFATVVSGASNVASGSYSTIGGGREHSTSDFATISGGVSNTGGLAAAVGGGYSNDAVGSFAAIGGGLTNRAYSYATVGGGAYNRADGDYSAVPGGQLNTALGSFSFAGGRRSKANQDGAFVWGDSNNVDKTSSTADQFNVYASGGTRIFSNSAATTGVLLAAGGGSWTSVSDRDAKENITPVDPQEILNRLAGIPVSTWNYKEQDDGIRHMGPMAQDFYAAFGLGLGDKTIDTIDPDGVALAAIQGLNQKLAERDRELAELRAESDARIASQAKEMAQLRLELSELREALGTLTSK